ncbi:MAG TPA: VOC family protein [Thermomicrobiales bacterium]|nr:VOC family protein [Thermomicrobiales bacterium]
MSATLAPPTTATGRFVWRDLMTTDPERAKAFYAELFGWTVKPMPMGDFTYEMLANGDNDFGGVMPFSTEHGVPSHRTSYIYVPSVDEATATATRSGATVYVPPSDIPGVGRFSVLGDPQGATFATFTDTSMPGETPPEEGMPPVGGVAWNELITADPDAARAFYGDVIGWQFEDTDMGGPVKYTLLKQGDAMYGGLMRKPDEIPVSMWVIYFHVADLDQSLAEITRLGGQPAGEIIPVPGVGRVSWASDPTGAVFALLEPEK